MFPSDYNTQGDINQQVQLKQREKVKDCLLQGKGDRFPLRISSFPMYTWNTQKYPHMCKISKLENVKFQVP